MEHFKPANITLYVPKTGTSIEELSLVASRSRENDRVKIIESGQDAQQYASDPDVEVYSPLREGQVAYFDAAVQMFKKFLREALGKPGLFRPAVVICMTQEMTEVEERAMMEAWFAAGAKKVALCSKPLSQVLTDPLMKPFKLMVDIRI